MSHDDVLQTIYYVLGAIAIVATGLAALWRTQIGTLRARVAVLEATKVSKAELRDAIADLIRRSDDRWAAHMRESDQRWEDHLQWGRDMSAAIKESVEHLREAVAELKEEARYLRRSQGGAV